MSDYKQTRDAAGKVTTQYDKMLRSLDDDLVRRLRDPAFGTETTERNLMDKAADRIEQLEREAELQAQEIDKTRLRADKWQSMVLDCEEYLKPGETPRQRMDRDHADVLGLIKLLEASKQKSERLEAKLAKAVEALQQLVIEYDEVDLAYDEPKSMTAAYVVALDTLAELTGGKDE